MSDDIVREFREGGNDPDQHGKFIDFVTGAFKYVKIGEHEIIQTPDGALVEHVLMEEDYFVENWLTQFAIARVNGKNYFDLAGWSELTEGFTKGVIILNENKELVFIIRKFTDMSLNYHAKDYMNRACRAGTQAHSVPDEQSRDEIITKLSTNVKGLLKDHVNDDTSITAMIPKQYYIDKGISVDTLQQLIYIRDNFEYAGSPIDPEGDIMKRLEKVLRKWNTEYVVEEQDKKFVIDITQGTFNFNKPSHLVEEESKQQPSKPVTQEVDDEFDPLG